MNQEVSAGLEADLLEDSNRVYHQAVTKFQLQQQEQWRSIQLGTGDWAAAELKKPGVNRDQIAFISTEHLLKTRKQLHEETERYAEAMKRKEETRNRAIEVFLSTRGLPTA